MIASSLSVLMVIPDVKPVIKTIHTAHRVHHRTISIYQRVILFDSFDEKYNIYQIKLNAPDQIELNVPVRQT